MAEENFITIGQKIEVIPIYRDPDSCYFSYIKDLSKEEILIDTPTKKGRQAPISINDIVKMNVTTPEAIYSANVDVVRNQRMPIAGFWVRRPEKFVRIQRRAFSRVPIKLPIRVLMLSKDGNIQKIPVETRDISGGGVSFYTNEDLNSYSKDGNFFAAIPLPDGDKSLRTQCKLVFCRPLTPNPALDKNNIKYNYLAAFQFLGLEQKTIDRICRFCFQYQLELKRKGVI